MMAGTSLACQASFCTVATTPCTQPQQAGEYALVKVTPHASGGSEAANGHNTSDYSAAQGVIALPASKESNGSAAEPHPAGSRQSTAGSSSSGRTAHDNLGAALVASAIARANTVAPVLPASSAPPLPGAPKVDKRYRPPSVRLGQHVIADAEFAAPAAAFAAVAAASILVGKAMPQVVVESRPVVKRTKPSDKDTTATGHAELDDRAARGASIGGRAASIASATEVVAKAGLSRNSVESERARDKQSKRDSRAMLNRSPQRSHCPGRRHDRVQSEQAQPSSVNVTAAQQRISSGSASQSALQPPAAMAAAALKKMSMACTAGAGTSMAAGKASKNYAITRGTQRSGAAVHMHASIAQEQACAAGQTRGSAAAAMGSTGSQVGQPTQPAPLTATTTAWMSSLGQTAVFTASSQPYMQGDASSGLPIELPAPPPAPPALSSSSFCLPSPPFLSPISGAGHPVVPWRDNFEALLTSATHGAASVRVSSRGVVVSGPRAAPVQPPGLRRDLSGSSTTMASSTSSTGSTPAAGPSNNAQGLSPQAGATDLASPAQGPPSGAANYAAQSACPSALPSPRTLADVAALSPLSTTAMPSTTPRSPVVVVLSPRSPPNHLHLSLAAINAHVKHGPGSGSETTSPAVLKADVNTPSTSSSISFHPHGSAVQSALPGMSSGMMQSRHGSMEPSGATHATGSMAAVPDGHYHASGSVSLQSSPTLSPSGASVASHVNAVCVHGPPLSTHSSGTILQTAFSSAFGAAAMAANGVPSPADTAGGTNSGNSTPTLANRRKQVNLASLAPLDMAVVPTDMLGGITRVDSANSSVSLSADTPLHASGIPNASMTMHAAIAGAGAGVGYMQRVAISGGGMLPASRFASQAPAMPDPWVSGDAAAQQAAAAHASSSSGSHSAASRSSYVQSPSHPHHALSRSPSNGHAGDDYPAPMSLMTGRAAAAAWGAGLPSPSALSQTQTLAVINSVDWSVNPSPTTSVSAASTPIAEHSRSLLRSPQSSFKQNSLSPANNSRRPSTPSPPPATDSSSPSADSQSQASSPHPCLQAPNVLTSGVPGPSAPGGPVGTQHAGALLHRSSAMPQASAVQQEIAALAVQMSSKDLSDLALLLQAASEAAAAAAAASASSASMHLYSDPDAPITMPSAGGNLNPPRAHSTGSTYSSGGHEHISGHLHAGQGSYEQLSHSISTDHAPAVQQYGNPGGYASYARGSTGTMQLGDANGVSVQNSYPGNNTALLSASKSMQQQQQQQRAGPDGHVPGSHGMDLNQLQQLLAALAGAASSGQAAQALHHTGQALPPPSAMPGRPQPPSPISFGQPQNPQHYSLSSPQYQPQQQALAPETRLLKALFAVAGEGVLGPNADGEYGHVSSSSGSGARPSAGGGADAPVQVGPMDQAQLQQQQLVSALLQLQLQHGDAAMRPSGRLL